MLSSTSTPLPQDFTIKFNEKSYRIVKFKASLYSKRFRELTSGEKKNSLEISAPVPTNVFVQFLSAIQGEEYTITSESAFDLYSLSILWKVDTLYAELRSFLDEKPDIGLAIERILSSEKKLLEGMEEIISANFDNAVKNSKSKDLPLDFLIKCVRCPLAKIKKMKSFFVFVTEMMNKHGKEASALAEGLDFYYLERDDAMSFLENPNLDPVIASDTIIKIIKLYANNMKEIDEKLDYVNDKISSSLQDPNSAMATITERIDLMKDDFSLLQKRITKFKTQVDNEVKALDTGITAIDKQSKAETKKENLLYEDIIGQIGLLESKFEVTKLMAKESMPKSPVKPKLEDPDDEPVSERHLTAIPFNSEQPFEGILTSLSQVANGNVNENGVVKITASSTDHSTPAQVADRGWSDFWFSQNKPGQWIMFDFVQRQVVVSNYTIKTIKFCEDSCHMKSWCIEGSADCMNWEMIDEQDTNELNGSNKIASFKCKNESEPCRYIRLRMTGPNQRGDNLLALNNIEFFGVLVDM